MVSQNSYSDSSQDLSAHVERELLELLLQTGEEVYPWNPLHPKSEAYFAELEQAFGLEDELGEEIEARSQAFFNQMDQLWAEQAFMSAFSHLRQLLSHRFAERVPQICLDAIATKATEFLSTPLSLAEQLVQCVQQVLPNWAEEDLQVLARPYAYAMRGMETEAVESTLAVVRPLDWAELSEVEQARLSLAIARYAFSELETMR